MDVIKRFMLFDKTILVSVISAKELVDKAIKIHSLSRTAAAALGRTLIVGAYMGTELKDDKQKLSITINGGGPLGGQGLRRKPRGRTSAERKRET